MPTDFAPYANLRLLIPQPAAAPANFRSGVPAAAGSWILHVFAKGQTAAAADLPSVSPLTRTLEGYITAWATLPANTSWLAASSAFTWDTTGLAPQGLLTGMGGRGFLGILESLPAIAASAQQGEATITGLAEPFGPGGIGAELRQQLGDRIRVDLHFAG
jgi:hypothetical protein